MPVGRVRTRTAFRTLRQHGRRARSGALRVTFVPAATSGAVRANGAGPADRADVAFAIGRPVGPAVVRNRLRRRLRAACAELDLAPGTYLLAVGPDGATSTYAELRDDLARAMTELQATELRLSEARR